MTTILFVEDDQDLCNEMSDYLNKYKIESHFTSDISDLPVQIKALNPDLLVLDQFIVGQDTLLIIPELRPIYHGGIVVFTGNLNLVDRIVALECGADDFISKGCDPREFVARLRSVLRRVGATSAAPQQIVHEAESVTEEAETGRWIFDATRGSLQAPSGAIIRMTGTEFDFIHYAERRAGELMTREQISTDIFQRKYLSYDRAVDNMLSRIRKLLDPHLNGDSAFRSIRGRGYVFIGLNRNGNKKDAVPAASSGH